MKRRIRKSLVSAIAATIILLVSSIFAHAQSYGGNAAALKADVDVVGSPLVTTAVGAVGPLGPTGGNISLTSTAVSVPSVLSVGASTTSTSGAAGTSQSSASISVANVGAVSNVITADVITANTNCSCPTTACTATSAITNLRINGTPIVVDGSVNQTVAVFLLGTQVGTVVINEQSASPGMISVNALHVTLTDPVSLTVTDVKLASAHSDISCAIAPTADRFRGQGKGVDLAQDVLTNTNVSQVMSDTGDLPASGGTLAASTTGATVAGLLNTGVVESSSWGGSPYGGARTTASDAGVTQLGINALGVVTIAADVLESNTICSCSLSGVSSCSAGSTLTALRVTTPLGNLPINITGFANQVVNLPLGLGSLVLNGRSSTGSNNIAANALKVNLNVVGLAETDLEIAASRSAVFCSLAPTAASVTLSGNILVNTGKSVSGANIKLTSFDGHITRAVSGGDGYFSIDGLEAGQSYVVEVAKDSYSFDTQFVRLQNDLTDYTLYGTYVPSPIRKPPATSAKAEPSVIKSIIRKE